MSRPGDVIGPVEVGGIAHGGHCVGRFEGRVVFIRHALPGERVTVRLTETVHASFWRGDAVDVLDASPDRLSPPCPIAQQCGGCDFQHVSLAGQRRLKASVIREQLQRLAGLNWDGEVEPVDDGDGLAWRTRMRYLVRDGALGMRAARSHTFVPLPPGGCPIASAPVSAALAAVSDRSAEVSVVDAASGVVAFDDLSDPPMVRERVGDRDFGLRADGFWQVHPRAAALLSRTVLDALGPTPGEQALDLYCGVGLFAAALQDAGCRVTGIEQDPTAVRQAHVNVPAARFVAASLGRRQAALPAQADLVVTDPPRAGMGAGMCARVAGLAPRTIAYVACDPAALARDLATFAEAGYSQVSVRAFDLFPMTQHVECVARLNRWPVEREFGRPACLTV